MQNFIKLRAAVRELSC